MRKVFLTVIMTIVAVGIAQADSADCCSCAFDETRIYPAHDDFQCSFSYPADWEARYDPWDNTVYVSAPRCKQRCGGARNITFTISKGKDNNADTEEAEALKQGFVKPVGNISCGGRESIVFQPPGALPTGRSGSINFHVGKNDDKAYDARASFSCSQPGEWPELKQLFIDSVR